MRENVQKKRKERRGDEAQKRICQWKFDTIQWWFLLPIGLGDWGNPHKWKVNIKIGVENYEDHGRYE